MLLELTSSISITLFSGGVEAFEVTSDFFTGGCSWTGKVWFLAYDSCAVLEAETKVKNPLDFEHEKYQKLEKNNGETTNL